MKDFDSVVNSREEVDDLAIHAASEDSLGNNGAGTHSISTQSMGLRSALKKPTQPRDVMDQGTASMSLRGTAPQAMESGSLHKMGTSSSTSSSTLEEKPKTHSMDLVTHTESRDSQPDTPVLASGNFSGSPSTSTSADQSGRFAAASSLASSSGRKSHGASCGASVMFRDMKASEEDDAECESLSSVRRYDLSHEESAGKSSSSKRFLSLRKKSSVFSNALNAVINVTSISGTIRNKTQKVLKRGTTSLAVFTAHIPLQLKSAIGRSPAKEKTWIFLEEPGSSAGAGLYALCMSMFIILSVTCTIVLSLDTLDDDVFKGMTLADGIFDLLFALEVMVRLFVCPIKKRFFLNFYNVVDVVSVAPRLIKIIIGWGRPESGSFLEFCMLLWPLLRLLKTARNFAGFRLLIRSLAMSMEALPVPLFMLCGTIILFSSMIYFVEPRDNIRTVPHAMWLVVATISTVGYGEVYPMTDAGRAITTALIVVGCFYMAMPLSIVGTNFAEVWQQRDKILLMDKTRQRLIDWGYSPDDMTEAFRLFDTDQSGELDVQEFIQMITDMHLGIPKARILELFQAFDTDGNGTISADEFSRVLYPTSWTEEAFEKMKEKQEYQEICEEKVQDNHTHKVAKKHGLQMSRDMESHDHRADSRNSILSEMGARYSNVSHQSHLSHVSAVSHYSHKSAKNTDNRKASSSSAQLNKRGSANGSGIRLPPASTKKGGFMGPSKAQPFNYSRSESNVRSARESLASNATFGGKRRSDVSSHAGNGSSREINGESHSNRGSQLSVQGGSLKLSRLEQNMNGLPLDSLDRFASQFDQRGQQTLVTGSESQVIPGDNSPWHLNFEKDMNTAMRGLKELTESIAMLTEKVDSLDSWTAKLEKLEKLDEVRQARAESKESPSITNGEVKQAGAESGESPRSRAEVDHAGFKNLQMDPRSRSTDQAV